MGWFGGFMGQPDMSGMQAGYTGEYGGFGMLDMGMGYPQGMGYGNMGYGMVKYTRAQMLDGLRNYVIMANQGRVMISKEEKIEETPPVLRHACAECGISRLQMLTFNIPEVGIQIPFYFCTACGKLYYYKDFYM